MSPQPPPSPPPVVADQEPLVPRRLALEIREALRQIAILYTEFHKYKYIMFNISNQINTLVLSPDPESPEQRAEIRRLNSELIVNRRQIQEIQFQLAVHKTASEEIYEEIMAYKPEAAE